MNPMRVAIATTLVAVSVMVAGCGAGDSGSSGPIEATSPQKARRILLHRQKHQLKRAGCVNASAGGGQRADSIEIVVRCNPNAAPRFVNFTVGLIAPGGGHRPPSIRAAASVPRIETDGASIHRGRCVTIRRTVACDARIKEVSQISIEGIITSGDRCATTVWVTSIPARSCRQGLCNGALTVRSLFTGRPEGC